jgi:5-methylcytosine-specific restriction endonuclease McrA
MDNIPQKHCSKCHLLQPLTQFYRDKKTRDGHRAICKDCVKAYFRTDGHKQAAKRWNAKQVLTIAERRREYLRKYKREVRRANHAKWREHRRHENARRRARVLGAIGTYSIAEWRALLKKYAYRCLCCGYEGILTVDHIIPLALGGSNSIDNIQPLCFNCNARKGATIVDYRPTKPILVSQLRLFDEAA